MGQGLVWQRSMLADCFSIYYCGNCKVWNLNIKCAPRFPVFSFCTTGNWPSLPTLRRLCPLTFPPAAPAGISADKKKSKIEMKLSPPLLEEMNRVWIGEQTQQNIWNNSTMYKKRRLSVVLPWWMLRGRWRCCRDLILSPSENPSLWTEPKGLWPCEF